MIIKNKNSGALLDALKNIEKYHSKRVIPPNTMNLSSPPSVEELRSWANKEKLETIDLVLEYLTSKKCLNHRGKKLAYGFWNKYIKRG